MRHRALVVTFSIGSMGLAWYFFANLEQEFLPEEDKGRFLAIGITPQGSTPEYTDRMMRQMETIASETPGIKDGYFSAIALPFNGPGDATQGFMFMRLKDGDRRSLEDVVGGPRGLGARFITEVEGAIAIPILPKAVDLGISQPFELVVSNPEIKDLSLFPATHRPADERGLPLNVRASMELTKPELDLESRP
ncbi:MAG: efflux RND transporter permease subunit [Verrucomicrobiales bacterium]